MKLKKLTFALLAGLLCFACTKESPINAPDAGSQPVELNNQYAIGDSIGDIGSVVEYPYENGYILALYEQEGITDSLSAKPVMEFAIAESALNSSINLATATADEVTITIQGVVADQLTGTLEINRDATQGTVAIKLEAKDDKEKPLRADYEGVFSSYGTISNQYAYDSDIRTIGSVVKYTMGDGYGFALFEQKGITDMTTTDALLQIVIDENSLGKTLDLASATADEVTITSISAEIEQLIGSLEVALDDTQELVTISLESKTSEGVLLRANYSGKFVIELTNQYAVNQTIKSIGSVVKSAFENGYIFALYEQEGITNNSASTAAIMEIFVAETSLGQTLDLASVTGEAVVSIPSVTNAALAGSLKIDLDETIGMATIKLESHTAEGIEVRANYHGTVVTYVPLNNQYALDGEIGSIGSIVRLDVTNGYEFSLYEATGVTNLESAPAMKLFIAESAMGQTLDLATITPEQATISIAQLGDVQLSGSLKAQFGRTGNSITIELESKTQNNTEVRANYSGAFATTYTAKNSSHITANGTASDHTLTSVLFQPAAKNGDPVEFAFTDTNATTAQECLSAKRGVWFSISSSLLYKGAFDLVAEAGNYNLTYIDYENNKIYDKSLTSVESGTISTKQATDGKVYILVNATLKNGTFIYTEFFGNVNEVADLDPMFPAKESGFYYYNADGKETAKGIINKVTCTTNTKGLLEFKFGTTESNSTVYSWPELTISPDFVNAGVIDCSNLPLNSFKVKYNTFQMESLSGNEYKDPYLHVPNNGTLEVSKDDAGNYSIALDMINTYQYNGEVQGDKYRLVITYQGAVIEQ